MAKANVVLGNGTKVTIEGTADEVASMLQQLSGDDAPNPPPRQRSKSGRRKSTAKPRTTRKKPKGPADYVRELVEEDFFKSKRGLSEVQKKLEERAHIYPVTHLSPVLYRLVKAKELRRLKEGGSWKYVNA